MTLEDLHKSFTKTAEGLETNNDDPMNDYENTESPVEDRHPGTIDAPWGEKGPSDVLQLSTSVWEEAQDSKEKLVDRVLTQFQPSAKAEKKLISELFGAAGRPGSYETRSVLLREGMKSDSLGEAVKKVTGRR